MKHDPLTVFTAWQSPLGAMTLAATTRGLCGVWFDGQRHGPDTSTWRRDPAHCERLFFVSIERHPPLRADLPDVLICAPVHLAEPGGLFVDKVLRFVVRLARVPGRVASDAGPGRHTCRAGAAIHTVLSGLITVRTSGTNAPRCRTMAGLPSDSLKDAAGRVEEYSRGQTRFSGAQHLLYRCGADAFHFWQSDRG